MEARFEVLVSFEVVERFQQEACLQVGVRFELVGPSEVVECFQQEACFQVGVRFELVGPSEVVERFQEQVRLLVKEYSQWPPLPRALLPGEAEAARQEWPSAVLPPLESNGFPREVVRGWIQVGPHASRQSLRDPKIREACSTISESAPAPWK